MTKIYSMTVPVDADIVDAFCVMQKGFTDQFVYYDKERPCATWAWGVASRCRRSRTSTSSRCAPRTSSARTWTLRRRSQRARRKLRRAAPHRARGGAAEAVDQPAVFFSFNRFDAENPAPVDELQGSFPRLRFMLPEVVLIENERGRMLQVNSLGRCIRVASSVSCACARTRRAGRASACRMRSSAILARRGWTRWARPSAPSPRGAWRRWCSRAGRS